MADLIYLASPYSHPDPAVREERFKAVSKANAQMLCDGLMVYSPIAHTHTLACVNELPLAWAFWAAFDETMISRCDRLWVLTLDGWDKSVGVEAEIKIAERLGKPLDFVEWTDDAYQVMCSFEVPTATGAIG